MKEEHCLSCELCGMSFDLRKDPHNRAKALEHGANCLPLAVGQRIEFSYAPGLTGDALFTGEITKLHLGTANNPALVSVHADQRMFEHSYPDPERLHKQGRDILVQWASVRRIL